MRRRGLRGMWRFIMNQIPKRRQQALGLGIGWRAPIALMIERRREQRGDLGFIEVIAESIDPNKAVPQAIANLQSRGVRVVPHGITLSLGGAEPLDRARVKRLAAIAKHLNAPIVSEHIAFVRAGGLEAGHLLPIARTRASLDVLVDNVKIAQDLLPVPLALENISALFDWPGAEMSEAEFLASVFDRTGALMLLDLANVHATAKNLGGDSVALLDALPLNRLAYVHVGGGEERDGIYHDTHAHAVPAEAFALVEELASRADVPGFMLERDEDFPSDNETNADLDAIVAAVNRGARRRVERTEVSEEANT
ncbi:MAG: DUF692 domain-containing protein [Anaerolineae bacterium]|nr:DUF692 domain-containing protein [Phycisphaerae bacterium]